MQEDDINNRRMLLAAALCLGVMLVYQAVFVPPAPPPDQAADGTATSTAADELATVVEGEPAPVVGTSSAGAAMSMPRVEPAAEGFTFEGEAEVKGEPVPFRAELTNVGGGIERFVLPTYMERDADNRPTDRPILLANPVSEAPPAELDFGQMAGIDFVGASTFELPARAVYEVVEAGEDRVRYRYRTEAGVVVERVYRFDRRQLAIELEVTVINRSTVPQTHQLQMSAALAANDAMRRGGGFFSGFVPPPDHLEAACYVDGSMERENVNSLEEGEREAFVGGVEWVGADRQYFLGALVPRDDERRDASCVLERRGETARASVVLPPVALRPGESRSHRFTAYLGTKVPAVLSQVGQELDRAVNYTVLGLNLAPLCYALIWILELIQTLTGSWGIAIIGLTVLVKGLLFPLNQKQGKSMRAMSALKPEMEKIKAKFPEDKQRQSEEMMRLYKEHNVNPAGGCLPLLLQMPIWFALYRSLWVSVDLYQEGFLWIPDLTTRDPYWILPVMLVVVMFIQQKMMPAAMDPAQQKIMMYTMPLMFGFLMAALPAGLCFYILVNTLLTIVQQHLINRTVGPPPGRPDPAVQGAKA